MFHQTRLAIRQDQSAPKIAAFETWLTHHRARVAPKSPLGEALKYIAKYWAALCRSLADGRTEMDNNTVERTIPPIALLLVAHVGLSWRVGGLRLLRRMVL